MHQAATARETAPLSSAAAESSTPATTTGEGELVVYFCPELTDATTLKRVQQFLDNGWRIAVLGFRRGRYNSEYRPPWPHVVLGETADGRYGQRLRALCAALPALFAERHMLAKASAFFARNLDQLLLALAMRVVCWRAIPVTYEVLDIPPLLTRRGPRAALVRALERFCLRFVDTLVLSSPGFHRGYFAAIQGYRGDWFLMENKIYPPLGRPLAAPVPRRAENKWVVGYVGLIRGDATFELMTRLAERLGDRVEFRFRGVLTTVSQAAFEDGLGHCANMSYGGPYLPHRDLEAIYREVDFAWAIDLEHTDHNSRWLLPCRFYEAGFYGVPCLAVKGFEVGALIERHRIGWTFEEPLEEQLVRFFEGLSLEHYERVRRRLQSMPRTMFVADADAARLAGRLARRVSRPARQSAG
ncbi:MAG TPA: hypothetical protein VEC14_12965 [Reyranellaceae bacterium]|nr:hypothetical protein [Reyranellaceae bacterium]